MKSSKDSSGGAVGSGAGTGAAGDAGDADTLGGTDDSPWIVDGIDMKDFQDFLQ